MRPTHTDIKMNVNLGSKPATALLDELFLLSRHYLNIHHKEYKRDVLKACFRQRLSILIGQRGVGKTTFIAQYLLEQAENNVLSTDILYIPVDHFLLSSTSLYEIADMFSRFGGKVIAFDEIHKYGNWSKELKSIYDTFPSLKIIASGSSALEIHKGSHDLTRRAVVYAMPGLSFREYLTLAFQVHFSIYSLSEILEDHEKIIANILQNTFWQKQKVLSLFKEYLKTGYFPYSLELKNPEDYFITLEQNFHTIIETDLPAIYPSLNGSSIRKIKHLLAFISTAVPFIPQLKTLKNIIDVGDERTLKTYFKYLEDARLIRMLLPATQKMQKIESPEKIYLDNPNQMYALAANPQNVNIGTLREVFFLNMLSFEHETTSPKAGDFLIDNHILFEIGGRNKSFEQLKNEKNAYLALDEIEQGIDKKIPLWLFGFLY